VTRRAYDLDERRALDETREYIDVLTAGSRRGVGRDRRGIAKRAFGSGTVFGAMVGRDDVEDGQRRTRIDWKPCCTLDGRSRRG
jgi:hypothetical protein